VIPQTFGGGKTQQDPIKAELEVAVVNLLRRFPIDAFPEQRRDAAVPPRIEKRRELHGQVAFLR
jgi:hypothetical protein